MRFLSPLLGLGLGFGAQPATAQLASPPPQECAADAAATALPPEFAGWVRARPLSAGTDDTVTAILAIDQAAILTLQPVTGLRYAVPPERTGEDGTHGGIVAVDVPYAGTYRVALSAGAWIDVVHDGVAVTSGAHGHGPACSGIRKIVDFPLTPGRYLLQIAGSRAPAITAMIVPSR